MKSIVIKIADVNKKINVTIDNLISYFSEYVVLDEVLSDFEIQAAEELMEQRLLKKINVIFL